MVLNLKKKQVAEKRGKRRKQLLGDLREPEDVVH
jgi:hypothetical protein